MVAVIVPLVAALPALATLTFQVPGLPSANAGVVAVAVGVTSAPTIWWIVTRAEVAVLLAVKNQPAKVESVTMLSNAPVRDAADASVNVWPSTGVNAVPFERVSVPPRSSGPFVVSCG